MAPLVIDPGSVTIAVFYIALVVLPIIMGVPKLLRTVEKWEEEEKK
jgi:hypothetical protein